MEPEKLQELQLATAYEAMESFLAYRDLMAWLEESTHDSEMRCANADPEDTPLFRAYFLDWQHRKKVLQGIKNRMAVKLAAKKELEEEVFNERPSSTSFDAGTDTRLPGYF